MRVHSIHIVDRSIFTEILGKKKRRESNIESQILVNIKTLDLSLGRLKCSN